MYVNGSRCCTLAWLQLEVVVSFILFGRHLTNSQLHSFGASLPPRRLLASPSNFASLTKKWHHDLLVGLELNNEFNKYY